MSPDNYPHLMALLCSARKVHVEWDMDELQADPIHNTWDWQQAREELRALLQAQRKEIP